MREKKRPSQSRAPMNKFLRNRRCRMNGRGGLGFLFFSIGFRRSREERDQLHVYVRYVPDKGKERKILDRAVGTPGVFSSSSFIPRNMNIFLGSGVSNFNEIFSRVSGFFPEHV